MTVQEMYDIVPDKGGWRRLPSGVFVKLGYNVRRGDNVKLGNRVTLGDYVRLGDNVTLGDGVRLGEGVTLGNYVRLGNYMRLGEGVTLGNYVTLGNRVTLGDGVELGDTPLAIQGTRHLATNGEPGKIQIGCEVYTFAAWKRHFKEIGKVQEYTPTQIKEYGKIIEFIIKNGRK